MSFSINSVPIVCINQAAVQYHVPATLIIAVLQTENGYAGTVRFNQNGTRDLGPMQINSCWLPVLSHYGFTQADIQYHPCKNVAVGAWILSTSIANAKTLQQGIGNYHSHTETMNQSYSLKVLKAVNEINKIIGQ